MKYYEDDYSVPLKGFLKPPSQYAAVFGGVESFQHGVTDEISP
jgi:hypothetical protein